MPLYRRRQLAFDIESTEGSLATITAADAGILAYELTAPFEVNMLERNPARSSYTPLVRIPGVKLGRMQFRVEMKGSGTAATAPVWGKLLKACGFAEFTHVTVGGSGTGNFEHGETVTQATTGATGKVYRDQGSTGSPELHIARAGATTFDDTYVITGATSGATYTQSGSETVIGIGYWPDSSVGEGDNTSLSMVSNEDAVLKTIIGSRGNVSFEAVAGQLAFLVFDFQGVKYSVADGALYSGITYPSTDPPVFLSANMGIDDGTYDIDESSDPVLCAENVSFNMNNVLAPRTCANSSNGVTAVRIGGRGPTGSFDPEMLTVATYPFHENWFDGDTAEFEYRVGSTAGNRIDFYMPKIQTQNLGDAERNGIAVVPFDFLCTTDNVNTGGDDEIVILHR